MCIQQVLLGILCLIVGLAVLTLIFFRIGKFVALFPALEFNDLDGFWDHVLIGIRTTIIIIAMLATIILLIVLLIRGVIEIGSLFDVCT